MSDNDHVNTYDLKKMLLVSKCQKYFPKSLKIHTFSRPDHDNVENKLSKRNKHQMQIYRNDLQIVNVTILP